jgi:uncharacterized oxidoreductase
MPASISPVVISHEHLHDFVRRIFLSAGSSAREAELIACQLVGANLAGHDSHGVGSLPVYARNVRSGDLPLNREITTVVDHHSILVFDGNGGAGQVMGHDAMARGIDRARETGAAIVGLRNSHHLGRIGQWAEQCAEAGMSSVHFVNVVSDPSVAPFGGKAARIGTNPFAVGIPRPGGDPIVVDFATSKLAVGKVRVAMNEGRQLPPESLLTSSGEPTRDPSVLFGAPKGILLPLGEHKGWCLGLACELLGAALTGGKTQSGPKSRNAVINSMFSIIADPAGLGTAATMADEVEAFLQWARSGPNGDVRLPGEPERETRLKRIAAGIPIDPKSWSDIVAAGDIFGVEPPAPLSAPVGNPP